MPQAILSVILAVLEMLAGWAEQQLEHLPPPGASAGPSRLADLPACPGAGTASGEELLAWLRDGELAQLDGYLEARQTGFERDLACEQDAWRAFMQFRLDEPWIADATTRWVEATPDSFAAHTVRGVYWSGIGRGHRGGSSYGKVTQERWDAMHEAYGVAAPALERALELRPRAFVAWAELIEIAKVSSGDHDFIFDEALEAEPASYRIFAAQLRAKTPRWGGSYLEMRWLVWRAQRQADRNPKLRWLRGYEFTDRALDYANADDPAGAVERLERALRYGDATVWYHSLANEAWEAEQYEKSVWAAEVAIGRESYERWALASRGRALRALGEHERSAEAMALLVEHHPDWQWSHFELGQSLIPLERWDEIETAWRRALEIDPDWYRAVQSLCTFFLFQTDRPEDAIPLALWMTETQPQSPPVWYWYAEALYRRDPSDPRVAEHYQRYLAMVDPEKEFLYGASDRAREVLATLGKPARPESAGPKIPVARLVRGGDGSKR